RPHGFLTGDEWRTLEVAGRPRRYRARQRLIGEGEPGDHVIAVLGGRVKVSVQTRSGREILLAIKEPGDLVGELSAIDGRPREATSRALGRLRGEGWLTTARQRIVLIDLPALRRRATEPA